MEKKDIYATEAKSLRHDLNENLHLNLTNTRVINIYDLFNVNETELETAKQNVLSEIVTGVTEVASQLVRLMEHLFCSRIFTRAI